MRHRHGGEKPGDAVEQEAERRGKQERIVLFKGIYEQQHARRADAHAQHKRRRPAAGAAAFDIEPVLAVHESVVKQHDAHHDDRKPHDLLGKALREQDPDARHRGDDARDEQQLSQQPDALPGEIRGDLQYTREDQHSAKAVADPFHGRRRPYQHGNAESQTENAHAEGGKSEMTEKSFHGVSFQRTE